MAARKALITKSDAARIFEAAKSAGFGAARIILHPDGRVEALATFGEPPSTLDESNSFDVALKAQGL